jgi:hypothetical protein
MMSLRNRTALRTRTQATGQENVTAKSTTAAEPSQKSGLPLRTALGNKNSLQNRAPLGGKQSNNTLKNDLSKPALKPQNENAAVISRKPASSLRQGTSTVVEPSAAPVTRPLMPARRTLSTRSSTALRSLPTNANIKPAPTALKSNLAPIPDIVKADAEPEVSEAVVVLDDANVTDDCTDRSASQFSAAMISDIDALDHEDPLLVAEYANNIYAYLRHLEERVDLRADFLAGAQNITPKMRSILVDWLVQVHVRFHLLPETLYQTVSTIDRFMQTCPSLPKEQLQLIGVSAMFIASKYEEIYAPDIADFVYITDNAYTQQQILQTEMRILHALNFDLSYPLALSFLRRFSKADEASIELHSMAKYLLELQLVEHQFSHVRPSMQAAVALRMAQALMFGYSCNQWTPTLVWYSKYTDTNMAPHMRLLVKLLTKTHHSKDGKLKAVRGKYETSKFARVSQHQSLSDPNVLKQINAQVATE